MDQSYTLYFYLEDYDITICEVKPIISLTNKHLVDMSGYWDKMKNKSDLMMAQTSAYWGFFKLRDDTKFDIDNDITVGGTSVYTIERLQNDFHVDVIKLIDEDNKRIYYKMTGVPGLEGYDYKTPNEWKDCVDYCIDNKGTHEQFKTSKLYGDDDTDEYVILQVFFNFSVDDQSYQENVKNRMFDLAKISVDYEKNRIFEQVGVDDIKELSQSQACLADMKMEEDDEKN